MNVNVRMNEKSEGEGGVGGGGDGGDGGEVLLPYCATLHSSLKENNLLVSLSLLPVFISSDELLSRCAQFKNVEPLAAATVVSSSPLLSSFSVWIDTVKEVFKTFTEQSEIEGEKRGKFFRGRGE